ncbi:MAG: endonuclease/exonuclease/phosphatase family protein [Actinobacteria bacterium]|nr:endonuclease/exonuclease/phosphatase family protein [Actinomycetota bacterium]MCG2803816.1 endonuclease/exonuclease/phosphatase family protein [Cellulomonas sp.]
MRVVSYNVHGLRCGAAVAEVLRELAPDVVGVQEPGRGPLGRWRLHLLCRRTGLRQVGPPWRTVALLVAPGFTVTARSRVRVPRDRPTVRRPLPRARGALLAEVGGLRVVVLHLGLSAAVRAAQLEALEAAVTGATRCVVLADLNERPGGPSWRRLASRLCDAASNAGPTNPADEPEARIDAVLVDPALSGPALSGPGALRAGEVSRSAARTASDHLPVVVDLAVDRLTAS